MLSALCAVTRLCARPLRGLASAPAATAASPAAWSTTSAGVLMPGTAAAAPARPRASFVCIGDEVLSGKIADTNTHTLAKRLFAAGIDLVRVQTIPDDEVEIANTLRVENARVGPTGCGRGPCFDWLRFDPCEAKTLPCSYVFTSGGIGPTHDVRGSRFPC